MGYWEIPTYDTEAETEWEKKHSYCAGPCNHRDCAEVRESRAAKCAHCGKGFEAHDRVIGDVRKPDTNPMMHFGCAVEHYNP